MKYTALIILAALAQYLYFTVRVGAARVKHKVHAPSMSGDQTWERMFRVQQNTMEQLVVFIPGMIIFSTYLSPVWAALPGVVFIVGRQLYSREYISDPKTRVPGMALSLLANGVLLLGGLGGLIWNMV